MCETKEQQELGRSLMQEDETEEVEFVESKQLSKNEIEVIGSKLLLDIETSKRITLQELNDISIVTPSGYRIEGLKLDIASLVELVKGFEN